MNILSDGKSNGIALTYVKNGALYSIALSKEEVNLLELMLPLCFKNPVQVLGDRPIAKVKNILEEINEDS